MDTLVTIDFVISALQEIAKQTGNKDLGLTLNETAKGMGITAVAVGVGGLLGGPVGLAIGGAVGGLISYATVKDFKSVPEILNNMTKEQKEQVYEAAKKIAVQKGINLTLINELAAATQRDFLVATLNQIGVKV